jgi:hypothetical protein
MTNMGSGDQDASATETGDSPKRQGDALGEKVGAGATAAAAETPVSEDSPKRQGDELQHAVSEAAKG